MTIKLYSNNKYFLDVLHKNPDTDFGLYAKPLKNGIVMGNAIDAHHYEIVFQDTKYSYLPEDNNSIDFQSYCNPLVALNIVSDFFANQLKSRADYLTTKITWLDATYAEIDTSEIQITIPSYYIHSSWYRDGVFLLSRYFPGIMVKPIKGKIFELNITAKTIFDGINILALTALLTHITNEYGLYTWIDDSFALKYARILTNIEDVPYFIFYLYIKRTVRSPKQFDFLRPIFEQYLLKQGLDVQLSFYGTHQERIKFITETLENDISIVDIGCGELQYFKKMMRLGFSKNYYAIDSDEAVLHLNQHIARHYEGRQLQMFSSIEDCTTTEQVNIIITEVIEHNTPEMAKQLLLKALNYNFNRIIVTTPNVSFNQFYGADLATRHDDHHFEWNEKEFEDFVVDVIGERKDIQYRLVHLGDKINNIQPTQAVIITKIN